MMKKILVTGTSVLMLLAPVGQAVSQETGQGAERSQDEAPPLPILIQDDLYILELGIGIDVEVRCFEPFGRTSDLEGTGGQETADDNTNADPSRKGLLLGPCGSPDGRSRAHRLLDQLQVRSDLAAEIKVLMERALRETIERRIKDNIDQRIRENRANANAGGNR